MITCSQIVVHAAGWQQQLAQGFSRPQELLLALGLRQHPLVHHDSQPFAMKVPRGFAARMERGNPDDPLLLQVLPQRWEHHETPGYSRDPLAEVDAAPAPGLIHKYHGRVLLVATGTCAIHCRYCFRRHFPYQEHSRTRAQWHESIDYIRRHADITEVILSGGDPLVLSDARLAALVEAVERIDHVRRLRIHTRLPIVLPERITPELSTLLGGSRLRCAVVVHSNHPNELDQTVAQALSRLRAGGTTLLNQSVLLQGINDSAPTLARLSETLFEHGVIPYYLHVLDPVAGAAHFDLPESRATAVYRELMQLLPGYLVPRLVREEPALPYKKPLALY